MPRRHTFRTWDDYFIPGTAVLRNKFTTTGNPHGEPDPDKLQKMEEFSSAWRLTQLAERPIRGQFDYAHMKSIHHHLFQDVYEWAGQERVAPPTWMTKEGHRYYPAGPELTKAAEEQYKKLAEKDLLQNLELAEFVDELAESWSEVNVVHSFREGNTRAQFAFYSQLAEHAGYLLDAKQFAPGAPLRDEFVQARFHSQRYAHSRQLAEVLRKALAPTR